MNGFILSFFTAILGLFHFWSRSLLLQNKVKEGLCARWCMDAIHAVCGALLSFLLYRYPLTFPFSFRTALFTALYLVVIILLFFLAPMGLSLFGKRSIPSEEEMLLAEYRFHDTVSMVRNYIYVLLCLLPLLFMVLENSGLLVVLFKGFPAEDLFGGFCFAAFLILVPITLRQALFFIKNLKAPHLDAEEQILNRYRAKLYYRRRNRIL